MRDHSTKSESKTTDRQPSQLHHIQRNNVIVFNPRAISVAGRNFLRRQRWRFRPLKRLILPARSMKRAAVEFIGPLFGRTILRLEPSSLMYANTHTEITITGYSIWCREFFCSNTQPKIFPTTTRSCSTVRERITNAKSWLRLECPRRKFAMLIRANVSKSHRLFFLPWISTLLLHGRFTDYAASLFLASKTSIAAFIFRGHAPQFAGSRMRTKSQRSCGIGISKLSKPKIFPGGTRQTC